MRSRLVSSIRPVHPASWRPRRVPPTPLLSLPVLVALLLPLALPATALAGGPWVVRSAAGAKMGSAQTVSATKGKVNGTGEKTAVVTKWEGVQKWTAWTMGFGTGIRRAVIIVHAATAPRWRMKSYGEMGPSYLIGKIGRYAGRWVVKEKVGDGWRRRGSVTDARPPWLAGGAVYLLDTSW